MLHQSKYKRGCDHTIAHLEFRPSLEGYKHKTSLGEKTSGLFERSSGLSERSTGLCERSSREGERSSSSQLSGVQASTSASYLNSSKSNSRYNKHAWEEQNLHQSTSGTAPAAVVVVFLLGTSRERPQSCPPPITAPMAPIAHMAPAARMAPGLHQMGQSLLQSHAEFPSTAKSGRVPSAAVIGNQIFFNGRYKSNTSCSFMALSFHN